MQVYLHTAAISLYIELTPDEDRRMSCRPTEKGNNEGELLNEISYVIDKKESRVLESQRKVEEKEMAFRSEDTREDKEIMCRKEVL